MSTKTVCPKCGFSCHLDGMKYCSTCGVELEEVEIEKCECGEDKIGSNYCPYCGETHKEKRGEGLVTFVLGDVIIDAKCPKCNTTMKHAFDENIGDYCPKCDRKQLE